MTFYALRDKVTGLYFNGPREEFVEGIPFHSIFRLPSHAKNSLQNAKKDDAYFRTGKYDNLEVIQFHAEVREVENDLLGD